MLRVTDQGDDLVATLGEEPGEAQGDLAVAPGNGYAHLSTVAKSAGDFPAHRTLIRDTCG